MFGPTANSPDGARDGAGTLERPSVLEECRALRQRLLTIAEALSALRAEIDRALDEGRSDLCDETTPSDPQGGPR